MGSELRAVFKSFRTSAPISIKYQVVTKIIQFGILFPIFWGITGKLLESRGYVTLNNANALSFLTSIQGATFAVLAIVVIGVCFLLEFVGSITLSSLRNRKKIEPTYFDIVKYIWRLMPAIAGPGLAIMLLFVVLVLPLADVFQNLSFLKGFRIPNFIMDVVQANPVYRTLYTVLIGVLAIIAFCCSFMFHCVVIGKLKAGAAAKASFTLIRRNWLNLILFNSAALLIMMAAFAVAFAVILGLGFGAIFLFNITGNAVLFISTVTLALANVLVAALSFLASPLQSSILTNRFYKYAAAAAGEPFQTLKDSSPDVPAKAKRSFIDVIFSQRRTALILGLVVIVGASAALTATATTATAAPTIQTVGHRGGAGAEAVENSLESVQHSIDAQAAYVEVDVQRTKDGHYVITHDDTFARLAGDPRTAQEMTLAEIEQLDLGKTSQGKFKNIKVPTLEGLLKLTQGKMGIFLELKGKTADQKMADDVIAMVAKYNLTQDVVFMSLDDTLITYIDTKYPAVTSGFVYFLSFGEIGKLQGDWLIVEEDAASSELIDEVHAAGKKIAVWTVNKDESMSKFVNRSEDAVITDHVTTWQEVAKKRKEQSPIEVIFDQAFTE